CMAEPVHVLSVPSLVAGKLTVPAVSSSRMVHTYCEQQCKIINMSAQQASFIIATVTGTSCTDTIIECAIDSITCVGATVVVPTISASSEVHTATDRGIVAADMTAVEQTPELGANIVVPLVSVARCVVASPRLSVPVTLTGEALSASVMVLDSLNSTTS